MRGRLRSILAAREAWVLAAFTIFAVASSVPAWLRLVTPSPLEFGSPVPDRARLRLGDPVRLGMVVCNRGGGPSAFLASYALRPVEEAGEGEDVIVLDVRPTPVETGCTRLHVALAYPPGHVEPGNYRVFGVATFRSAVRDWDLWFESEPFEIYREGQ